MKMNEKMIISIALFFFLIVSGCAVYKSPAENVSIEKGQIQPSSEVAEEIEIEKETLEVAAEEILEEEIEGPEVEEPPLTFEQMMWKQRIDAAMAPSYCPPIAKVEYPGSYYQSPLIDTHLHIPGLADWPADEGPPETQPPEWYEEDDERNIQWGEDAFLGHNINIGTIDCTLRLEGTIKAFSWFPIYPELPLQQLEVAKRTAEQYPERIVPFISPTEEKAPTVKAQKLKEMLSVYPSLFQGYGEIGIYDTTEWKADDFQPDAPFFLEIYPIVEEHNLIIYFHPGERQEDNFDRVLRDYPNLTFIVHGEEIEESISDLMVKYKNIYYTVDFSFGDYFPLFVGKSKKEFIDAVEKDFERLLAEDIQRWKTLIEKHPDRFMWGTDRGDAVWNYDMDVGLLLVKYARAFTGKLNPTVQEKFAYKNALEILREGEG